MFNGRHSLNLDAKGRLAVPTRFRDKLKASCGGSVVITQHPYDDCLCLYPEPRWEEVADQVAALSDASQQLRRLKRRFLGQAVDLELDSNGRILVPAELRALISLEKATMLVGQMHRLEIWSETGWQDQMALEMSGDLPDEAQALSF